MAQEPRSGIEPRKACTKFVSKWLLTAMMGGGTFNAIEEQDS